MDTLKDAILAHLQDNSDATIGQLMNAIEKGPQHWYRDSFYQDIDYNVRELVAAGSVRIIGYRAGSPVYKLAWIEPAELSRVDRYLRIIRWLRKRYAKGGVLVTYVAMKPTLYTRLVQAFDTRYSF